MIATSSLFDLIQSLSKAEKRSFKLMISSQGNVDTKNIALLFDYIEKQNNYDEAELKKYFKGFGFIKQLTATKYYLYNLILKSLKNIGEAKTIEGKVLSTLQCVPILNQKKLYKQSMALLGRAQKAAEEKEFYVLLYEAYSLEEKTLYYLKNKTTTLNRLKELVHLKNTCLDKMQNQSIYQNYRTQIFSIVKEERFLKQDSEFKNIEIAFQKTVVNNPPNNLSSVYNKHYSLGLIYFYKNQFKKSFDEYKILLSVIEKSTLLNTDIYKLNYLNAAQNCIVSATYIPLYDDFVRKLIVKLETDYKDNPEYYLLILRLKLALLIEVSNYDEAIKAIEKSNKLSAYLQKAESHIYVDVTFSAMQAYLWAKNYKKTIRYLQLILQMKQDVSPRYVYIVSLLIEILIHIELQNYDLLESLCPSYTRVLEHEKESYHLEHQINDCILKHVNKASIDNKPAFYKELLKICTHKTMAEPLSQTHLFFNLEKWLKSFI